MKTVPYRKKMFKTFQRKLHVLLITSQSRLHAKNPSIKDLIDTYSFFFK